MEVNVAEMLEEMAAEGPPARAPVGARPPKMRYNHVALADYLLTNPGATQREAAAYLGYTEAWISTIMCSDAFKVLLHSRREDIVDPELRMSLRERAEAMASKSLQILQAKLSRPPEDVPDLLALRAFELGSKALGLGAAPPPPPPDPAEYLPELARRLMRLNADQAVDVEVRQVA
jgi:hypothetical protein